MKKLLKKIWKNLAAIFASVSVFIFIITGVLHLSGLVSPDTLTKLMISGVATGLGSIPFSLNPAQNL